MASTTTLESFAEDEDEVFNEPRTPQVRFSEPPPSGNSSAEYGSSLFDAERGVNAGAGSAWSDEQIPLDARSPASLLRNAGLDAVL